ncbi:MAG TPA: hypothetical protein VKZ84_06380 [Bacteriovoracaceae bacterium]|nr:hypothetical protein [Bacteriovoracaceae bacterium]
MTQPEETLVEVLNVDFLLHRQIFPSYIHEGRPTKRVFKPRGVDNGLLSTHKTTSRAMKESCRIYREILNRPSGGVAPLTVGEVNSVSLKVFEDPTHSEKPEAVEFEKDHCVVDFRGLEVTGIDAKAIKLLDLAITRGPFIL